MDKHSETHIVNHHICKTAQWQGPSTILSQNKKTNADDENTMVTEITSFKWQVRHYVHNKKAQLARRPEGNARQQCMYEGPLRTNVKSVKTSILVLKVVQGHCFRCQSKPVYDFLLVINCNLGPILHRFPDMATFTLKSLAPEGGTAVQGHPRSSILVLMKSLYVTSY